MGAEAEAVEAVAVEAALSIPIVNSTLKFITYNQKSIRQSDVKVSSHTCHV